MTRSQPWRPVLFWVVALGIGFLLFQFFAGLGTKTRSNSVYVLNNPGGWRTALLYLGGLLVLVLVTSFIGKLMGDRARGRPVRYLDVLGDQLTHVFIWVVLILTLYPLVHVIAASTDPNNNLFQIPEFSDAPVLLRSRVIPAFNWDFSNYAKLFVGINLYWYQWWALALSVISLLGIMLGAVYNFVTGNNPGRGLRRYRAWTLRALIVGLAVFFLTLNGSQFTGGTNESKFLIWVRNSFMVSSITGILAVLVTTTAGYAMARLRFPGRFQTLLFFIFVQMFPNFLGLVAIFFLISSLGLLNTFPGLILAYSGGAIAFGTWIYKGYVESLPHSLEEAALVDGATRWVAFWRIVLPLSGPMLVFIFLLQFIGTYTEFILANVLMTGVDQWNVGVGLRSFATQFTTRWGIFSAASILGSLPIVALFYSFQQVFVSGTVAGGVKE
ncbi:MAG TPA: sugar ABC transporter permease [Deinococcales bacterium]|nr:sugar ABC transporter permease [Deinococcales bacterium]